MPRERQRRNRDKEKKRFSWTESPVFSSHRGKGAPVDMALSSLLALFALLLVYPLGATFPVPENINVIAGTPVVLPCEYHTTNKVVWKYEKAIILHFTSGKSYKGDKLATYSFGNTGNGNFSLVLPDAKEGSYTCDVEGQQPRTFDLKIWKLTQSLSGYLLQGETLLLELHSSDMRNVNIEWFGPSKAKVTGKEPRWELKSNNQKLEIKNLTVQEDQGTWKCCVLPKGPQITCNVKVIGFFNASDGDMAFAAVNSSMVLSCPLNIDLQKEPGIPKVQAWKWVKNSTILVEKLISVNASNSFPVQNIPMVQFEDAGKYQCHLTFSRGNLKKTIHLVVMKVSADRLELSSKEPMVTLCCHISAPAPHTAKLCWVTMNETKCGSDLLENKFCHNTTTAGLWRCDLKVKSTVKLSMNHTVGEATTQNSFRLVEVATGAGGMLLLFIFAVACVPTCKTIKRKRQITKRMTQAKQHLLAKRTCQCQRELTNDYYHT